VHFRQLRATDVKGLDVREV